MDFFLKFFIYALPVIVAITFHEAAHGYVALRYGDDTALVQGRVTLNPLRHVDLFGTLLLPAFLFLVGSPFLFGYAKPVPVDFRRLDHPKQDMVKVAAAGPLMNLILALASAFLYRLIFFFPESLQEILQEMLTMSLMINITLGVFNMLPLPPLDGGRVAVGLLPPSLAHPLARLERAGMLILFTALILVPLLLSYMGIYFSPLQWLLKNPIEIILKGIKTLSGIG